MATDIEDIVRISDLRERLKTVGRLLAEQQAALADLARLRRQTIAGLRAEGLTQAQVAGLLGVPSGRLAQLDEPLSKSPSGRSAVLVERSIPTDPSVRASASLFLGETDRQGLGARRQMLRTGAVPAPSHVASRLGVPTGEAVAIRSRLMLVDQVPVRIASSYFPLPLAHGTPLLEPDFVDGGLQRLFESLGHRFGRAVESFTVRMPTPEEASLLQLGSEVPVVAVLRSSYDDVGRPVHTIETICAGDRHVFPVRQADDDSVF